MHWTEKSAAKAHFALCVKARGWELIGYSKDMSDARVDYFAPASWAGLATRKVGDKVFVLNVSAYKPTIDGKVIQDNPGKASWHVECDGVILDSGMGVFANAYDAKYGKPDAVAKVEKILDRIDAATIPIRINVEAIRKSVENILATNLIPNDRFTVRDGTKAGYSEILFKVKPDESIRNTLKAAGYRWSPANGVWYGKTNDLPGLFRSAPEQTPEDINEDFKEIVRVHRELVDAGVYAETPARFKDNG